jgi:LuxR family maltose regulon positive regulatory protein
MNDSIFLHSQLLATKFFIPAPSRVLISRPRLTTLLKTSLDYPLTQISAPAGFGKTTLLASWVQSLAEEHLRIAWISLDEEDNQPLQFWTYVFTALDNCQPGLCTAFLHELHSPQAPSLETLLQALVQTLSRSNEQFLLILDDYHLITQPEIHSSLAFFVTHFPAQLHLILTTRIDLSVTFPQLLVSERGLKICTEQLRCTEEEALAFLHEMMGLIVPIDTVRSVMAKTEGWFAGLQLFALSLQGQHNPLRLLTELHGNQRYILDYLLDEVLQKQLPSVQTFLLYTSLFEHMCASLCDEVVGIVNSQEVLEYLHQQNVFIVPLDEEKKWYRYHPLFAEALRHRLERFQPEIVSTLHYRASRWYAEQKWTTRAILHAFRAHEWNWAAELIERIQFSGLWGTRVGEFMLLQQWLEQLPAHVVNTRPRLCLVCAQIMCQFAPSVLLWEWLDKAERGVVPLLRPLQLSADMYIDAIHSQIAVDAIEQGKLIDLLCEIVAFRAYLLSFHGHGNEAVAQCQYAMNLLSEQNILVHAHIDFASLLACYLSCIGDATLIVQRGEQAGMLALEYGSEDLASNYFGGTVLYLIGIGQLHRAEKLVKRAWQAGLQPDGKVAFEANFVDFFYADVLREWNQLDEALRLVLLALARGEQTGSYAFLLCGYAMLAHIYLSRGELDAAQNALQRFDVVCAKTNFHLALHLRSFYTVEDQVRLWLAEGKVNYAISWAEDLEWGIRGVTPLAREREEVARVRVLLAQHQPGVALLRLDDLLRQAIEVKRWGHVLEMWLLQARAYQMQGEEEQALAVLVQAVQRAMPEGYVRSFVDEGPCMAVLLNRLRTQAQMHEFVPYLDTVLAAFPWEAHR